MVTGEPLEKLFSAAETASSQARNIWVTFLLFGTYLAITVGATTHRDLLLENPVRLPLLDVDLNLFTFYWVAPLFFIIFHLYLLIHLYLLASKLHALNVGIEHELRVRSERTAFRQRLDGFPLTQMLAGPHKGPVQAGLVRLMVWVTVILAPVILLLAFQVRFLPYHAEAMTWWHRGCLLVDVALLWALWPRSYPPTAARPRGLTRLTSTLTALALPALALVVALLSVLIATVPDEGVERMLLKTGMLRSAECSRLAESTEESPHPGRVVELLDWSTWRESMPRWDASKLAPRELDLSGIATSSGEAPSDDECKPGPQTWRPTAILFEGPIDHVRGITTSPFARNLVLPNFQITNSESRRRSEFRGRDLRSAYLARAQLASADLQGSILSGVMLDGAELTEARLGCIDRVACVNLERASLRQAKLDRADLSGARLARARLDNASLVDALLPSADAQLADFSSSNLRGADLRNANLTNADLARAALDGADLFDTDLESANLRGASLRAVNAVATRFNGAVLAEVDLRGSRVVSTGLGVDLKAANLIGADLGQVNLSWTVLEPLDSLAARLHLADFRNSVLVRDVNCSLRQSEICEREAALATSDEIRALLPFRLELAPTSPKAVFPQEDWRIVARVAEDSEYSGKLAAFLTDMACNTDGATYLARGITRRLLDAVRPEATLYPLRPIAGRRLLDRSCAGAAGLPTHMISELCEIVPDAPRCKSN
ncbi:pentapeptide repeat-containing protein [Bradyrhizobium sp. sBnM-33]|uniref:pentapeptide repeat-containing protein n=1 Tax=Bradyrhizobium sp. sBnM-33 TaxID=2831780 RepID=UPI001BCD9966|nr:pentapeptide repeat-containing protein [Bradyrhizobium sp. sBnM-33]WOH51964.1 pentapeptide repeat-containing protein [Bradyrhizobium sp. sBnM-33]